MKKLMVILIALLVTLSISMAASAQEEQKVKGTVTRIDTAAKSVTIKPASGDEITVVMDNADSLSKVKEGAKGEAKYVTKDGKNVGLKLRKITEGCE